MAFMFEKLEVYQKAVTLADQTAEMSQSFPRGFYFLSDQLNRAALSIATNLAEGNGRFTKPDRKHFFVISRGSTQECVPLHPTTQVAIFMRPEQQMKMIGHQAIPDQSHRNLFVSLLHKSHKGGEVFVLMKYIRPTVAPVEHVIHKSTLRCSSCSSHADSLHSTNHTVK